MNRRQKIIVSVTGIFLVLLLLVGLTYAYFLTQITGNQNTKSISVTTANLALDWIDGTDNLIDSSSVIIPGEFESSLTFSVKNNGNSTVEDYGVIVDDLRIKWASTIAHTEQIEGVDTYLEYPNDMELKITCSSDIGSCNENEINTYLPTTNEILLTNSIIVGETQTYEVTLKYVDSGIDQSADMNKIVSAKLDIIDTKNTAILSGVVSNYENGDYVQSNSVTRISSIDKNGNYKIVGLEIGEHKISIIDKVGTSISSKSIAIEQNIIKKEVNIDRSTNAYTEVIDITNSTNTFAKGTLAYEIINNSIYSTVNGTKYSPTPLTIPNTTSLVGENERTLSVVDDDYGKSYYYRGNVSDNYLNFAGMCWRIVRIEGDGSIKLMLASKQECNVEGSLTLNSSYEGKIYNTGGACESFYDSTYSFFSISNDFLTFVSNSSSIKTNNKWCVGDFTTAYKSDGTLGYETDTVEWGSPCAIDDDGLLVASYFYKNYFDKDFDLKCSNYVLGDGDSVHNSTSQNYGALTKNEVIFAGLGENSYLIQHAEEGFGLITPHSYYDTDPYLWSVGKGGNLTTSNFKNVPVISLIKNILFASGNGTVEDPYVLTKNVDLSGALGGETITIIEGMTWKEWANSSLSNGYTRDGDNIILWYASEMCDAAGYEGDGDYTQYYYIDVNDESLIEETTDIVYYDDGLDVCK